MKVVISGFIWFLTAVNCEAGDYFCEEQHHASSTGVFHVDPGGKA